MIKAFVLRNFSRVPNRESMLFELILFGDSMYTDRRLNEHTRLEEEYFYKKDRELIEKMHEDERKKQELLARTAHYHKCACCGHDMKETVHDDLQFLQCTTCENVHMSMETLQLLTQGKRFKTLVNELQIRHEELVNSDEELDKTA